MLELFVEHKLCNCEEWFNFVQEPLLSNCVEGYWYEFAKSKKLNLTKHKNCSERNNEKKVHRSKFSGLIKKVEVKIVYAQVKYRIYF